MWTVGFTVRPSWPWLYNLLQYNGFSFMQLHIAKFLSIYVKNKSLSSQLFCFFKNHMVRSWIIWIPPDLPDRASQKRSQWLQPLPSEFKIFEMKSSGSPWGAAFHIWRFRSISGTLTAMSICPDSNANIRVAGFLMIFRSAPGSQKTNVRREFSDSVFVLKIVVDVVDRERNHV